MPLSHCFSGASPHNPTPVGEQGCVSLQQQQIWFWVHGHHSDLIFSFFPVVVTVRGEVSAASIFSCPSGWQNPHSSAFPRVFQKLCVHH